MNVVVDRRTYLDTELAALSISFEYVGVSDRAMCAFGQVLARHYFDVQDMASTLGALNRTGRIKVWVRTFLAGMNLVAVGYRDDLEMPYARLKELFYDKIGPSEEKEMAVLFGELSSSLPYYEADVPVLRAIRSMLYREVFKIGDSGNVDLRDLSKILMSISEGRNVSVVLWNMEERESLEERPIFVTTGLPRRYEFEDTTVVGLVKKVKVMFKPLASPEDYASAYDFVVSTRSLGYKALLQRVMDYILIAVWDGDAEDIRPVEDVKLLRREVSVGLEGRMKMWHNLVHFGSDALERFAAAPAGIPIGDTLVSMLTVRGREV